MSSRLYPFKQRISTPIIPTLWPIRSQAAILLRTIVIRAHTLPPMELWIQEGCAMVLLHCLLLPSAPMVAGAFFLVRFFNPFVSLYPDFLLALVFVHWFAVWVWRRGRRFFECDWGWWSGFRTQHHSDASPSAQSRPKRTDEPPVVGPYRAPF